MKIRREPPSEKLEYRINAPLNIKIGAEVYRTRDWSLDGFTIANFSALQISNAPIVGVCSIITEELRKEAAVSLAALSLKPVNKSDFIALLDQHVRKIDGTTPSLALDGISVLRNETGDRDDDLDTADDSAQAGSKRGDGNGTKKRVLYVIGNEAQRAVSRAYAQNISSYTIDFVENCRSAVGLSKQKSYDLIILEMNDTKLRGAAAADQIRALEGFDVGGEFECELSLPFQGYDISFSVRATVEGYNKAGEMTATFVGLDERATGILSFFAEELIRGSMTAIDDVILHLDQPVELVSQSSEQDTGVVADSKPFSPKLVLFSALYLLIGALVIGYTYLTINANFMQLEIEAAVVNAPLESLLSPTDGKIAVLSVLPGHFVEKSGQIAVIENAALEENIEMARIKIERMLSEFGAKSQELVAETDRYRNYGTILKTEIEQAEANINSLRHRTEMALNQKRRFEHLLERGYTTRSKVDTLSSAHAALVGEWEQAELHLGDKQAQYENLVVDSAYTNTGRLKDLKAELALFETRITLAEKELEALEERKRRLVITAPTRGRIVRTVRSAGNTTKKGEQLIIFERDEPRNVLAYLTQDEVIEVGLGDEVLVYFPSIDERAKAKVAAIDRTEGYVDEMHAQYSWRGAKDRTALVTLNFLERSNEDIRQSFPPGLPAIVIFERRDTNEIRERWKSTIKDTFMVSAQLLQD